MDRLLSLEVAGKIAMILACTTSLSDLGSKKMGKQISCLAFCVQAFWLCRIAQAAFTFVLLDKLPFHMAVNDFSFVLPVHRDLGWRELETDCLQSVVSNRSERVSPGA